MSLSVCLSVCLYVCPLPKKSTAKLHAMFNMAVDPLSSGNTAICYVLPVLWMTSCLAIIIGQVKATPVGRALRMTHQEAALGAKSDDYDCLVVVVVVIACIDFSD